MSKLKFSKISGIFMLSFALQLGACAKEVPATDTQEPPTEQAITLSKVNLETVAPEVKKTEIIKPVVKEVVHQEPNEKIIIASVEPVKAPQVATQTPPQVQAESKEKTAAQSMLNLDQYKGKVVYLDFWASWCVPCQQTFPWMDAMQKKYPDDIVFVAVNFGESPDDTVEFLKRFPADIKFVYDPLIQIASEYGVPGLPYSFIYGRNGELLGKHAGFSGGSEINLEAALKNLFESGE